MGEKSREKRLLDQGVFHGVGFLAFWRLECAEREARSDSSPDQGNGVEVTPSSYTANLSVFHFFFKKPSTALLNSTPLSSLVLIAV